MGTIGSFVHWSIGPLVHWSIGPLVTYDHWTIGPWDHWSIGPLVNHSISPLVHWSIGPLVHYWSICPNVNKVKLLSERTSGVPPVIFNVNNGDQFSINLKIYYSSKTALLDV